MDDADALYDSGKYAEAFAIYAEWLDTATVEVVGVKQYVENLFKAVYTSGSLPGAIELISGHLEDVPIQERASVLARLAQIEEAGGRYKDAQFHYETAAYLVPGKQMLSTLLSSSRLLLEFGDYEKADAQARAVVSGADDFGIRLEGNILLSRVKAAKGEYEEAVSILKSYSPDSLSPAALLWLYRLSTSVGDHEMAEDAYSRLSDEFPQSSEFGLIRGAITYKPSMTSLLGIPQASVSNIAVETPQAIAPEVEKGPYRHPQPDTMLYIQTGSFTDKENAEYFAEDLKNAGFETVILEAMVKGSRYYRVAVPAMNSTLQDMILLLKEKGFEGYPLYSE